MSLNRLDIVMISLNLSWQFIKPLQKYLVYLFVINDEALFIFIFESDIMKPIEWIVSYSLKCLGLVVEVLVNI